MRLPECLRERRWSTVLGYVLFVALMVAGYYCDVTFVQFGLIDLGTRPVGLSEAAVSAWTADLAAVVGVGAVVNTYFGLQRFEPVAIPGGAD